MKGEIFRQVEVPRVGRNAFDLSHSHKTSLNMGELVPVYWDEMIPGDVFNMSVQSQVRFQALASPAYHKCKITLDWFAVPYRILWPNWKDFITGQLEVTPPYAKTISQVAVGDLGDYLGLPTDAVAGTNEVRYSAFPIAAYYKIYDEWYRDQNLIAEKYTELIDGFNSNYTTLAISNPLRRAWHHDYFTSALPWAQKGAEVTLPLLENGTALVETVGGVGQAGLLRNEDDDSLATTVETLQKSGIGELESSTDGELYYDPNGTLHVDINQEASTIRDIRIAVVLQEFFERLARVGTRYTEFIQGIYDTFTGDARVQRPEWIGRHTQVMQISEVLSTAETGGNVVGEMMGRGISAGNSNTYTYKAKEHTMIMCIMSVTPTTGYHQGLERKWTRDNWLDYAIPQFAHIGEQEIRVKELFLGGVMDAVKAEEVFGYIPRYSEYKYNNDRISGQMRSSLAFWHLNRVFNEKPTLNEAFIECKPDHRIFAVTTETVHKLIAHLYFSITAIRPLPKFGVPKL